LEGSPKTFLVAGFFFFCREKHTTRRETICLAPRQQCAALGHLLFGTHRGAVEAERVALGIGEGLKAGRKATGFFSVIY